MFLMRYAYKILFLLSVTLCFSNHALACSSLFKIQNFQTPAPLIHPKLISPLQKLLEAAPGTWVRVRNKRKDGGDFYLRGLSGYEMDKETGEPDGYRKNPFRVDETLSILSGRHDSTYLAKNIKEETYRGASSFKVDRKMSREEREDLLDSATVYAFPLTVIAQTTDVVRQESDSSSEVPIFELRGKSLQANNLVKLGLFPPTKMEHSYVRFYKWGKAYLEMYEFAVANGVTVKAGTPGETFYKRLKSGIEFIDQIAEMQSKAPETDFDLIETHLGDVRMDLHFELSFTI